MVRRSKQEKEIGAADVFLASTKTGEDRFLAAFSQDFPGGVLDAGGMADVFDEDGDERYSFRWKGKRDGFALANGRSFGALLPDLQESVSFESTRNLYIEGDNLEVLKLLSAGYARKIKVIYIDPPYNTGSDFVYADHFADPVARYKERTGQTEKANPETAGRYHTNWLNMMYPRLLLASGLLRDDGAIFISIDDNEVHHLRKICDEIFGEEHFAAQFPWRKRTAKSDVPFGVSQDYEWILLYAKSAAFRAGIARNRRYYETPDYPGRPWRIHDMKKQSTAAERPNSYFDMVNPKTGERYPADRNAVWRITKDTFRTYYDAGRIVFPGDYGFLGISNPVLRYFQDDDARKDGGRFGRSSASTHLPKEAGMTQDGTREIDTLFGRRIFGFPKPVSLIRHLLAMSTGGGEEEIVLDFFSGSATTAEAVLRLNTEDGGRRRFIMVQLPERCSRDSEAGRAGYRNIAEIGRERIRRAGCAVHAETDQKGGEPGGQAGIPDVGFRALRLDSSSILRWDAPALPGSPPSAVRDGRGCLDVVFEIMQKLGRDLSERIEALDIGGKIVFFAGEDRLAVCLSGPVSLADGEAIISHLPSAAVFSDSCFDTADDRAAVRRALEEKGILFALL